MADLFEYHNVGDNNATYVFQYQWRAQTFTPSTAHKITSVKLKLYRIGSPGTVTVSIKATDGSGHPAGSDLCSGTIDGNTLIIGYPGAWYEIALGAGHNLSANTKYAIVVKALSGDPSNDLNWLFDSFGTYIGGNYEDSDTSGLTWEARAYDLMFEDWGEPPAPAPSVVVTLQPGESKVVSFEATPYEAKTYQVSIDGLTGSFRALSPPPFTFGNISYHWVDGPTDVPARSVELDCVISNPSSKTITHQITLRYQGWLRDHWMSVNIKDTFSLTLDPGESYNYHYDPCWWDASRQMRICDVVFYSDSLKRFWLEDELGNQSAMCVVG